MPLESNWRKKAAIVSLKAIKQQSRYRVTCLEVSN